MQVSNFDVYQRTMAADCVNGGTFNFPLLPGKNSGVYANGIDHRMSVNGLEYTASSGAIAVTFPDTVTGQVTNNTGGTIPQDSLCFVQLDRPGVDGEALREMPNRIRLSQDIVIDIGTPKVLSANGIAASQAVGVGGQMVLVGGSPFALDVPRNVTAAWTGTSVCTVRGKDEFGAAMTESSASGVAFTGKKAFASVTSITFSAAVTAAVAGYGNVLGLPTFLQRATDVTMVIMNTANSVVETGFVAGSNVTPTATTGDVRGTYTPAGGYAIDGTRAYTIQMIAYNIYYRGLPQYAG
jgi:hypothetical protein